MKKLEKFSKKIGFTSTETNVVLFLLIATLFGIIVNIIKDNRNESTFLEFDYKNEDSLFNAASGDPGTTDSTGDQEEKKIASQPELLDFTKRNIAGKIPDSNSSFTGKIDINNADAAMLSRLPGIGMKISNAIVDYRVKHGRITSLDELLNIKGIGRKKLEKIKNYIVLE